MSGRRSVALLATLSTLGGCSFLLVRGPRDVGTPAREYPRCTSSMTWPAVDGVLGILAGIGVLSALNQSDADYRLGNPDTDPDTQRTQATITFGILTAVAGVSAFVGYQRVRRCTSAQEAFVRDYQQGQPTWGTPQPGWGGQPYPPPQPYPQPYPQPQPQPPRPLAPAAGSEGGACMTQSACQPGLACSAGYCVRTSAPPPSNP